MDLGKFGGSSQRSVVQGSRQRQRKRSLQSDTDVQSRQELWVLGKQKQEGGRRGGPQTRVQQLALCEQAMTRRYFTWYRSSVPDDAAGAARAELLLFIRRVVRQCETWGEVFVSRRRHIINVVHLLL